jgi:hypothetical protein
VALAAVVLVGADDVAVRVGIRLCALAFLSLVAALVLEWSPLVALSVGLVGAAYAVRLAADDPNLDAKAALLGAGLLLTAELAYWSLEERERVAGEPGESFRRFGLLVALALAALGVGIALLIVADVLRTGGLAVDLVGAAAAAAALLVVVLFARGSPGRANDETRS